MFGNTASSEFFGFGGGISFGNGSLRILNSTISGNSAAVSGGGIEMAKAGPSSLLLRLTTVTNNTASREGGGILTTTFMTTIQLDHSIVANGAPQDLASFDYSLIEAPGDAILVGANNLVGVDPALGPLAGNGGPTLTHRPLAGSPVVDAGNPAIPSPPASDQRGSARIAGTAVDLGSVEGASGIVETPTLSQVGMFVLSALLVAAGVRRMRVVRAASG